MLLECEEFNLVLLVKKKSCMTWKPNAGLYIFSNLISKPNLNLS